jgi:hypothetical protein
MFCKNCNKKVKYGNRGTGALANHYKFNPSCRPKLNIKSNDIHDTDDTNKFYNDANVLDDVNSAQDVAQDDVVHENVQLPSDRFLNFQDRLISLSPYCKPFNPGRVKDKNGKYFFPNWKNYADVFYLQTMIGLSDSETTQLMQTFGAINDRQSLDFLDLPNTSTAIQETCSKAMKRDYDFREIVYPLDPRFYIRQSKPLAVGISVNLLELVSEQLIGIHMDDFHFFPCPLFNDSGDKCVREPATADLYKEYFDTIQSQWGTTYYPLCITISGDDLALNKSQTAGACPWYVHVANLGQDYCKSRRSIAVHQ